MKDASKPKLLVASQAVGKMDIFDAIDYTKLGTVTDLPAQPHEIAYDPKRRRAYVASYMRVGGYGDGGEKSHEIAVIDIDRAAIVEVIDTSPYLAPHDVAYCAADDTLYAGVEMADGRNGLIGISPETRKVTMNVPTEAPNTHWITVLPDGSKAYLAHKEHPVLTVIDLKKKTVIRTIPMPGGSEEISCSPDGRWAFVASPMLALIIDAPNKRVVKAPPKPGAPSPRLVKIDTATDKVVAELELDQEAMAVRAGPAGVLAASDSYFPRASDPAGTLPNGLVHLVDIDSFRLLGSTEVEVWPFTVRFDHKGERVFAANLKSGTVSVIDVTSRKVVASLDNNKGPFGGTHGLSFVPPATT